MKRGRIILSLLSGFLVIALLIGSTGATISIKKCDVCGVSVNTTIFSSDSPSENSCCASSHSDCSQTATDYLSKGCCTFTTEDLKLTNYFPVQQFVISFMAEMQPVFMLEEIQLSEEQHKLPLFIHNKHGGGRDILITNRQFLI